MNLVHSIDGLEEIIKFLRKKGYATIDHDKLMEHLLPQHAAQLLRAPDTTTQEALIADILNYVYDNGLANKAASDNFARFLRERLCR